MSLDQETLFVCNSPVLLHWPSARPWWRRHRLLCIQVRQVHAVPLS